MSKLWSLLVAAAACGAPAKPAVSNSSVEGALRRPARQCPYVTGAEAALPWRSELFPACPTLPMGLHVPVCDGPCPRPCATDVRPTGMRPGWGGDQTFAYDAQGHWISSTRDGEASDRCTWTGERMTSCVFRGEPVEVARDAGGRISAVISGETTLPVMWDAEGRVVAIGATTLTYDGAGDLVVNGKTTYEHDERGRMVLEQKGGIAVRFQYDAKDRVIAYGEDGGPVRGRLGYDDQGRLLTVHSMGDTEDDGTLTTYLYDCGAPATP